MTYIHEAITAGSGTIWIDVAGQDLGKHKLVYKNALGRWSLADADAVTSMPVLGITLEAIASGLKGKILLDGYVGDAAWTWTVGGSNGKIYASQTAGELTQTAPGAGAVAQCIAVAFSSTSIWFNPAGFGSDSGLFPGDVDIAGTLTVDTINEHTVGSGVTIEGVIFDTNTVTIPSLTAGRVPYAGASGLLTDEAGFEYNAATNKFTAPDIIDSGLTASRLVASDGTKELVSSDLNSWVAGTANEITVTDDGDGTITLDIPDAVTLVNLTATDIDVSDDITVDTIDEHTADTGVTIEGVLLQDGDSLPYDQVIGVEWNQTTDTWTQIDIDGSSISPTAADFNNHQIWGNMTRVNLASDGTVNARWGDGDYAADGSNGEVMVEVPCFYVKGEQNTTGVYQWWISRVELPGFEPHPAFLQRDGRVKPYIYLSAYEGSLLVGTGAHDDTTTLKLTSVSGEQPWTGEEILELTYNSGSTEFTRGETLTGAISGHTAVVIDWYLSGGTWAGGDAAGKVYLKKRGATIASTPFQAEDLNGSTGGANMASATGAGSVLPLTIGDARGYAEAQGDGWGLLNIWSHAAVKLLFIIEYGNMDSQTEIGRGIVDKTSGDGFNGEVTGYDGIDGNLDSALTGTGTGANGLTPICYRGLENLWGNTWSFLDGYNALDAEYRIISRHGRDTFADALMDYEASSMAPITSDGYIINIEWDRTMKYLFIPSAVGGGSGTYIPDYFHAHDAGETNILLSGGDWYDALIAGLGCLNSIHVASISYRYFGARTEYMP